MKLFNIGFGSVVSTQRVVAMVSPESAPIKRLTQEARERGTLVDASYGRKTQTVLIMDSGHVILSSLAPDVLSARAVDQKDSQREMEDESL
jgi:extracellular matrix regulatory protein A